MEERRRVVRRQQDRDMIQRYRALLADQDESIGKEARRRRRHAIRHNCAVKVALEIGERRGLSDTWSPSEYAIKGRILDLSLEGCSLFTRDSIEMGQRMRLVIKLGGKHDVASRGTARWTKAIPARGGFATGIQFDPLDAKAQNQVLAFLKEMDETAGL
jgi:hypothetical protein